MSRLAADLARALDPVLLSQAAGISPDPWQADLLRSQDQQTILLCSRQSGKSTTCGTLAYHTASYHPHALILLVSPSLRQSQELFKKVQGVADALGPEAHPIEEESALRLELSNGSRIVCLPGKASTIRGYSGPRLILIDEAAQVDDETYQSLRPMMAVSPGGQLILLSTPHGKRGFFHHEWSEGGKGWRRVKVTAADCPRITPEWLEAERAQIGDWHFRQEYLCEFCETEDQWISYDLIRGAISDDLPLLFGGWKCSS
jgi:hypothetical protein